jgi:outer membrane biosynthesis protein TonB
MNRRARRGVGGQVTKLDFKFERPSGCRLDRSEIQRIVNLHIGEVQQCYERELLKHAGLSGKIRIEWVIRANGTVKSTRQAYSSLDSPTVARCIMAAIRSWRFRGSACGEVTVAYPFIFESLSF